MADGASERRRAAMRDNLVSHFTALHRAAGLAVWERPGLAVADSGLPCDTFNVVYCWGACARCELAEAVAHFRGGGRPFAVWVGPDGGAGALVTGEGLSAAEEEAGMVLAAADFRPSPLPAGLTVARVADAAGLADFAGVVAANWSPTDPHVLWFFQMAREAVLGDRERLRLLVGYSGGAPVATAEVCLTEGVGGIYGVATRAGYRERGIGSALTSAAVAEVLGSGRGLVTLQASAEGRGVYERLGFRAEGRFVVYS